MAKGRISSLFGGWFRVVAYPLTRAISDVMVSKRGIQSTIAETKAEFDEKKEKAAAADKFLAGKTPEEKFQVVYTLNKWTESELKDQHTAVRRMRRCILALGLVGFLGLLVSLAFIPMWMTIIFGPMAAIFAAGCCALGVRYAWWEFQLEGRVLVPLAEFWGRSDVFKKVFS